MPVGEHFHSWQLIWKKNPPPPDRSPLDKYNPSLEFNDTKQNNM